MNYFRSNRFLDTLPDWETGDPPEGPLEDYLPRMRALLTRLENPQEQFDSIIVGGTNGKGTVSHLLAELLKEAGFCVGLYTSPHLHTIRERIRVDGEVIKRDVWAEGASQFYDKSRDFEREGYGAFSKFEALTALAAHQFARAGVDWAIFEVGLGGQYDATNAWDSKAAVLTTIQLDHTDVLGDTVAEIAADKVHITRPGRPIFTGSQQVPEVLDVIENACAQRGSVLQIVDVEHNGIENRPLTYSHNAALAVAVARHVVDTQDTGLGVGGLEERKLTDEAVNDVILNHHWPGRFEVVQKTPPLILDGAHNPDAVCLLVQDLERLADQWTFVVGVNKGHDAQGILDALAPLAAEIILTESAHPKAISTDILQALVSGDVAISCADDGLDFLQKALMRPTCVVGSLHLVALAREVLDLPRDQDSFSEDVILESLRCLETACRNLGVVYEPVSSDGNVIRVVKDSNPLYFLRNKHPFNDYVSGRLAEDKGYQAELFGQAGVMMPRTLTAFNPLADRRFDRYKTHTSVKDIVADVIGALPFPVVVKRNRGSMAQGVYLEVDADGLEARLQELCVDSSRFDNVLLIQVFVEGPEYRIVASQNRLLLAYEKQNDADIEGDDLNPLHQSGGVAIPIVDEELLADFQNLVHHVNRALNLGFYAIDLIAGADGFYVLEVNPNPICHFYNLHNGRGDFVQIYQYLVQKYLLGEQPVLPPLPGAKVALI